jgi:hypothetical protein
LHPALKRDCEFIFRIAQNIFDMQISIIIIFVFHHRLICAIYVKANIRNFIVPWRSSNITWWNIDILFKIIQAYFSPSFTQNSSHSPKNQKTEFKFDRKKPHNWISFSTGKRFDVKNSSKSFLHINYFENTEKLLEFYLRALKTLVEKNTRSLMRFIDLKIRGVLIFYLNWWNLELCFNF